MNKSFKDLDLNNAFLFSAALEDPEICQIVLEIILGRKIPKVNVHSEHNILLNSNFRSVRLDVYAHDELQVGYNIESQNKQEYNLSKRSRYYQAEMDVASLKPGEDFNALKPGYVIFICTFDPFGKGLYRYTFEERCLETNMSLGDETRKIFLNTKGKNTNEVPRELVNFLHYMEESTTEYVNNLNEPSLILLHKRVSELKQRRELEASFMTLEEYMRQEIEEGLADGFAENILDLLSDYGSIPEELKHKILAQSDIDVLKKWSKLAARSTSIEEFEKSISDNT